MKKKTVLIIDDDRTLLNELKTMLQLNGYDAEVLDDTSRAVRVAEEIQPEVILLDLKMSGKSGFQIADDLKHFAGTVNIPVIAMTGYYTEQQHKKFTLSLGISDFLIKPFDPQALLLTIDKHFNAKISTSWEQTSMGAISSKQYTNRSLTSDPG